jgi:dihydroxyacetone kinase-like predicted kinase
LAESAELRRWLDSGANAIKRARNKLDEINVFPVADADTGTNLYLTLQEGNRAVAKLPASATHREVVAAFARGALMGARGNSGVIVSQYLSAFLGTLDLRGGLENAAPRDIAAALEDASDAAYAAVSSPVEGTILTVARAAAKGAHEAADVKAGREATIVAAVVAARVALAHTHEILPSARAAGVVDAGAAGLVLQLEMLAETIAGLNCLSAIDEVEWEVAASASGDVVAVHPHPHSHPRGGAYEVMFVITSAADLGPALRSALAEVGDSVSVSGGHGIWQAHVHTDEPDQAVRVAARASARQMLVRNIAMGHASDRAATGVVALTGCPGLAGPLADAGAVVLVVPDPSTFKRRELRRAVKDASQSSAVVVAGSPELRAAAQVLADRRRGPRLTVLDANHEAHVVAAVAAAAVVTPGQDLATQMAQAVAATVVGESSADALDEDLDRLVRANTEVVTLILAAGKTTEMATTARLSLRALAPAADVNVYEGGQTHPDILFGVEAPVSA